MQKRFKLIIYSFISFLLLASLFFAFLQVNNFFHQSVSNQAFIFSIESGSSLKRLAYQLHKEGKLSHPEWFIWSARIQGKANSIRAGKYQIEAGTTPNQLLQKLLAGKVIPAEITLIEGWTFQEMMDAINNDPLLTHQLKGLSPAEIMAKLGHADENPEGLFFPDTYHFSPGSSDRELLLHAYETMQKHLQSVWENRAVGLPYEIPYQALIVASLIEKETAVDSERALISSVIKQRLQKRMYLQIDASTIYGLGVDYQGKLHAKDLQISSPYNTYRHKGLPPTPIAMPSEASLQAGMHPAKSKMLYFVAIGDGRHAFSETLKEHDKQVLKYIHFLNSKLSNEQKIRKK